MMKTLVRTQTFAITFLSPVHIGTEEQLDDHDFVDENGRLIRFRVTPLLERMDGKQLNDFVDEGLAAVKDWIRRSGLWQQEKIYEATVPRSPNWRREPIRPFIADPLFRPYLPGTEIKGAIRTAVAWWLLRQMNDEQRQKFRQYVGKGQRNDRIEEQRDRRWAGQWLEQSLLGEDPNYDLLRSLRVQDGNPVAPNRLKVLPVLVAVRTNLGLRWLQSPRRQNQPSQYTNDHTKALANFCECLDESVSGVAVTIASDDFLTEGEIERGESKVSVPKELRWEDAKREAVANWQKACNEFAKTIADLELNWWQQVKRASSVGAQTVAVVKMERFYDDLLKRIQAEGGQAVFINLGWGSGWRMKTVTEIFGDETVQRVVSRYGLDRGAGSRRDEERWRPSGFAIGYQVADHLNFAE